MFRTKFSLRDEADFTRKLSMYLFASLSLSDALVILENESLNKKKAQTFSKWRSEIEEGKNLAIAFDYPGVLRVSDSTKNIVRLGENNGSLAKSLESSAFFVERVLDFRKKILSAVAYPTFVLIGTFGLVLGILFFVFPKITPLFVSLGVPLPFSTRLLIYLMKIVDEHWLLILVLLIFITVGTLLCYVNIKSFKNFIFIILIRIPFVGPLIKGRILIQIFDSLQTLINGNESLDLALIQVAKNTKQSEYARSLLEASEAVTQGKSLAAFLKEKKNLYPSFIPSLISVGEKTGNISISLKSVAEILQTDLNDRLKIFITALEPFLMISMSLLIGFVAVSIILPIYGITSHFQNV